MADEKQLLFRFRVESEQLKGLNAEIEVLKNRLTILAGIEKENGTLNKKQQESYAQTKTELIGLIGEKKKLTDTETANNKVLQSAEGSMARLRAETSNMTKEINNLNLKTADGKKRFDELSKGIEANKKTIRDFDRGLSGSSTLVGEYSKGIITAFSQIGLVVAGVMGGVKATKSIIEANTGLTLAYKTAIASAEAVTANFFRTLMSGKWDNFVSGLVNAVSAGAEYVAMMAKISNQKRAERIDDADAQREVLENMVIMRSANKSLDERLKAAERVIEIEDSHAVARAEIRRRELAAAVDVISAKTNIDGEYLKKYIADYDNQSSLMSNQVAKYIELQSKLGQLIPKINEFGEEVIDVNTGMRESIIIDQSYIDKYKASVKLIYKEDLDQLKEYYPFMKGFTSDYKDQITELMVAVRTAENSSLQATMRSRTTRAKLLYASILAEKKSNTDLLKQQEEAYKAEVEIQKDASEGILNEIKFRFAKGEISQQDYEAALLEGQIQGSQERLAQLKKDNKDTSDEEKVLASLMVTRRERELKEEKGFSESVFNELKIRFANGEMLQEQYEDELLAMQIASSEAAITQLKNANLDTLEEEKNRANLLVTQKERELKRLAGVVKAQGETAKDETEKKDNKLLGEVKDTSEGEVAFEFLQRWILKSSMVKHKAALDEIKDEKKKADAILSIQKDAADKQKAIEQASSQVVSSLFQLQTARYERSKQRELAAAGENAAQKEAIEKKYAKKQQQVALTQAIINTSLAVINALKTDPFWPVGVAMGVAAGISGGVEIATIASQEFAEGGKIASNKGTRLAKPTSKGDDQIIIAKTGEVILNERQQAALGGARTFRQIGVPGFENYPAFAGGGVIGNNKTFANGSMDIDYNRLSKLIAQGVNEKEVVLSMNDLSASMNRYNRIKTRQNI